LEKQGMVLVEEKCNFREESPVVGAGRVCLFLEKRMEIKND